MGRVLKEVAGKFLVVVSLLLFFAPEGQCQELDESGNSREDYCVLQVGDLDNDGKGDFVVSAKTPTSGLDTAYVFLDGRKKLPASFDDTYLGRNATYVLKGSAASPFICTPRTRAVTALDTGGSENRLTATDQSASRQALSTLNAGSPINQPPRYAAVDLKTLGGPLSHPIISGINSSGQVVGGSPAFLYDGSQFHVLGTLGGDASEARSINDSGDIVGFSLTDEPAPLGGYVVQAFQSDGFTVWSLGGPWSYAFDINNRGQAAGYSYTQTGSGEYPHATIFENGGEKDLGTLGGRDSYAFAINDAGHVVGESTFIPDTIFDPSRAFVYKNGAMQDLGVLGRLCFELDEGEEYCFERSSATDINDREQIAGFSTTDQGYQHAFLITGDEMEDLGTLGGFQSWGHAVNDSGQVVGTSLTTGDAAYHAFLYDGGTMYDLNDLVADPPAGFPLWQVVNINNFGQIVGLNYLLNPEYETILPGEEYSFSDGFEKKLTFQYWIDPDDSDRCVDPWAFARIEVKIEAATPSKSNQTVLRRYLNRWLPADRFLRKCAAAGKWQNASLTLPASLKGSQATVRVRIREYGSKGKSTVYLRRFTME